MKIASWNINGIRATYKSGLWAEFLRGGYDIVCIQEMKAEFNEVLPNIYENFGYHMELYASKVKKGHAGVATFSKKLPKKVEIGLPSSFGVVDDQGRTITTYFEDFVLVNCYFPNGGGAPEKLKYKLEFYDAFLQYVNSLRTKGFDVIWCGDVNVAHNEIDLARPKENENNVGFLPIEREWMDGVVESGWVDVFRTTHPSKVSYTYWDQKTYARARNVGWRIDYFFVDAGLMKKIKSIEHKDQVQGSDHCPVVLDINI